MFNILVTLSQHFLTGFHYSIILTQLQSFALGSRSGSSDFPFEFQAKQNKDKPQSFTQFPDRLEQTDEHTPC